MYTMGDPRKLASETPEELFARHQQLGVESQALWHRYIGQFRHNDAWAVDRLVPNFPPGEERNARARTRKAQLMADYKRLWADLDARMLAIERMWRNATQIARDPPVTRYPETDPEGYLTYEDYLEHLDRTRPEEAAFVREQRRQAVAARQARAHTLGVAAAKEEEEDSGDETAQSQRLWDSELGRRHAHADMKRKRDETDAAAAAQRGAAAAQRAALDQDDPEGDEDAEDAARAQAEGRPLGSKRAKRGRGGGRARGSTRARGKKALVGCGS